MGVEEISISGSSNRHREIKILLFSLSYRESLICLSLKIKAFKDSFMFSKHWACLSDYTYPYYKTP